MNGEKMSRKIKICVLHGGAISNAGDFLIYERGKKLLENFFDDNFDFTYILRSKAIDGDFDGLIILGGPLITRKLHLQSKNITEYIQKGNENIPIFCIGLGISGEKFDSYEDYFLDQESSLFWGHVYKTTKLFSVRDKITYNMLKNYGIKTELTGCSALFNLETLEKNNSVVKNENINKIAVTIPNLSDSPTLSSIGYFLLTLYFLLALRLKFSKKEIEIGLFFQHGYSTLSNKIIRKLANMTNIKTYDISGKSLDTTELHKYNLHIGTRLHSHIYFLSLGKPSFLLSVDMGTEAFLETVKTPNEKYTFSGIKNLVATLKERVEKNNFEEFSENFNEIKRFYKVMKTFLSKIDTFYKEEL